MKNFLAAALLLAPVTSFGADHCKEGEEVVASCAIAKKKTTVSVCKSGESFVYRYGVVGGKKLDLEIVAKRGDGNVYSGSWWANSSVNGKHLRFVNADYSYVLSFDQTGSWEANPDAKDSATYEVMVFKGDTTAKPVARLFCDGKPEEWELGGGDEDDSAWGNAGH